MPALPNAGYGSQYECDPFSRSILGTINDFAIALTWALAEKPNINLHRLSLDLCETPGGVRSVVISVQDPSVARVS